LTKLVIIMEYYDIENKVDLKELEYGFETIWNDNLRNFSWGFFLGMV
jgi:hypothetical protein